MWTFSHDDLVAAREEAKRDAEQFGGNTAYQRLGNAHLWLDEHDEARHAFEAAAEDIRERVFAGGRGNNASTMQKYGLLLLRTGDDAGARAAFEQALPLSKEPWRDAELRHLLGRGASPKPRDEIVKLIRAERTMPDSTAPGMTLYDQLEATFPDETSHLEMLRQAELLGDAPPPAAIEPPPVGRWTVRDAVLENDGEGPIVARLGGDQHVEFVEAFGQWEVRTRHGVTGMHDTFGEAVDAAIDALRAQDEHAVAGLTDLLKQYGQPH